MAESWLARFDRSNAETDLPLLMMLREAQNRAAHRDHGEPLRSASEIRLQLLQERLEARELHRRADAGDRQAVAALVRQAAELELLLEAARTRVAEEEKQLRASIFGSPAYASGAGFHWRPPGSE